jgi:N6-adenosine-specific RNA methylase IME4
MPGPKADNLPMPAPPGSDYRLGSIDPPWHFAQFGAVKDETTSRSPQKHYPTMSLDHLAKQPIGDVFAKDAFLFMWITGPLLVVGAHLPLLEAWGFRPSSMGHLWIKTKKTFDTDLLQTTPLMERDLHCGTSYSTLQNGEFCILARRGKPERQSKSERQVIIENLRAHSRKPEGFYARAERFGEAPRIDIFGGRPRAGWDYWGMPHWGSADE